MGIIDNALSGFGLERKNNPPAEPPKSTQKSADMTTGSGAWFDIFGGSGQNITFTQFNNMKQQLSAYQDWVYAAAHTIAEQSAGIDLRAYVNNSKAKNASISSKFFANPERIFKYLHSTTSELVTKNGIIHKINTPQLEELETSPLLDLLNNPNPYMSRFEFFEITFLHMELTGNCFWAINRDKKGNPNELWPLMPQFVSIVPDKENFIIGYVYNVNNENIPFAPDDVIHHKYSNPNDLRYGMSTVQAAARAIDTDVHAGDYNRKFFYNSAQPDAVLYTDAEIDEKMYKRLVSQWRDTFGGTANSHRTAILENGLKYQPRVLTQKDMDFLAGRNFNRDMILGIFGVPKGILGLDESMSRANLEAAQYGFMKGKIRPKMERLCDRITQDLAIQFDKKLIISFTDPVPADKEFLLNEKKTSLGGTTTIPWRTPNEIRAQDGDEPIPGGDFLYISNTLMAMAEDPFEPRPETAPSLFTEDQTRPNDEEEPTDEEDPESGSASPNDPAVSPAPAAGSTGSATSVGDKSVTAKKKDENSKKLQKEIASKDFTATRNAISDKFEIQFLRVARVIFQDQKQEVLTNIGERFGKAYKPNKRKMTQEQRQGLNGLFTAGAWAAASVPVYQGAVKETGDAAISYAVDAANLQNDTDLPDQTYDSSSDAVNKFYDERSTKVSAGIDDETDKQLKASLAEGINAGESIPELANRVENIYGAAAGYRAEAIARTESINSSTFATLDAWKQSGVVTGKVWTTTSGNPCPYCLDMNGKTVGLGDNFFDKGDSLTVEGAGTMTFDYQNVAGPPAHVNCYALDTEVLTNSGWQLFSKLSGNEKILSVDLSTQNAEWVGIKNKVSYHVDDIVTYKSKNMSLAVSADHNQVVKFREKQKGRTDAGVWKIMHEHDLPNHDFNFLGTILDWKGKTNKEIIIGEHTFNTKLFAEFMGYFLSEGSFTVHNKNSWQVMISQMKPENYTVMEKCCRALFSTVWSGKKGMSIPIKDVQLIEYFKQFGKSYEKFVPRWIKDSDKDTIKIFIDAYALGDGHIQKGVSWKGGNFSDHTKVFTSSDRLASDLGELILKTGKSPYYTKSKGGLQTFKNGIYNCRPVWRIAINNTITPGVNGAKKEIKPYNDFVYDVELEKNHTLFVRYNGHVLLSGNCGCDLLPIIA